MLVQATTGFYTVYNCNDMHAFIGTGNHWLAMGFIKKSLKLVEWNIVECSLFFGGGGGGKHIVGSLTSTANIEVHKCLKT